MRQNKCICRMTKANSKSKKPSWSLGVSQPGKGKALRKGGGWVGSDLNHKEEVREVGRVYRENSGEIVKCNDTGQILG